MAQRPHISAPVRYRDANGQDLAAMVVKILDADSGLVNLHVFAPDTTTDLGNGSGADVVRISVPFNDGETPLNAWHW